MKPKGVLSVDDTLLTHFGHHFEEIAFLFDHVQGCYVWAHNLVTVHYSDDLTDYPVRFQLWKPANLERIEQGLIAAGVRLKESKQIYKNTDPAKWRQYLLGVWRRHAKQPEVAELYDSKLRMAEQMLSQWKLANPELDLPVTFDTWYTQPGSCHYLDQKLHMKYVGTLKADTPVLLKSGEEPLTSFANRLKAEHLAAQAAGGKAVFRPIAIDYWSSPSAFPSS